MESLDTISGHRRPDVGAGKALSTKPILPKPVREVAILVTGAKFHSGYKLYAHVLMAELRVFSRLYGVA